MTVPVRCTCGHSWFAAKSLAGGLTNCPRCEKATTVPGLRDPFWRVLQLAGVAVWVLTVALLHTNLGLAWAVGGAIILGALFALICIAL